VSPVNESDRLAPHPAAGLGAEATCFLALLAVIHAVRGTLRGAPLTNFGTQITRLLGEWTVARDGIRA